MASLTNLIAALRREVATALEETKSAASGTRLEAERVVLSLQVSVRERLAPDGSMQMSFDVVEPESRPEKTEGHRLTLEFRPVSNVSLQGARAPAHASAQLNPSAREEAITALSGLLGAPGFDSSARATVFREAFAGLSEAQTTALLASLSRGAVLSEDPSLQTARHRINGVLRTGPLHSVERGAEALAEIFTRWTLGPVLVLLEEKWKTQEAWLNAPG